jgi:NAD-dependent SIR2 family protein deacetylase
MTMPTAEQKAVVHLEDYARDCPGITWNIDEFAGPISGNFKLVTCEECKQRFLDNNHSLIRKPRFPRSEIDQASEYHEPTLYNRDGEPIDDDALYPIEG